MQYSTRRPSTKGPAGFLNTAGAHMEITLGECARDQGINNASNFDGQANDGLLANKAESPLLFPS